MMEDPRNPKARPEFTGVKVDLTADGAPVVWIGRQPEEPSASDTSLQQVARVPGPYANIWRPTFASESRGFLKDKEKEAVVGLLMCAAGAISWAVSADHILIMLPVFCGLYSAFCLAYFWYLGEERINSVGEFVANTVTVAVFLGFCIPGTFGLVVTATILTAAWPLAIPAGLIVFGWFWLGAITAKHCGSLTTRIFARAASWHLRRKSPPSP
jgi:hypothetical protein